MAEPAAAPGGPALAARDLSLAYRSGGGVAGVDLTLAPGEIVGLLGPNGAGKSTLVRLLAGLAKPDRGEVTIGGARLADLPPRERARRIAVVPQEPQFDPAWTALEVALLGRHPYLEGIAFESERDVELARAALASIGAAGLARRPVGELSSGERQRVVFARALAQAAPVMLLDEAGSFLDLRYQVELYDRVRELAHGEGRAIGAVMHDLNLAAEYCDRVLLLDRGRVVAAGATSEVLTYAHLTRVYSTEIYVDLNDLTGSLVVTPLSGRVRERLARRDGPGARGSQ